MTASIGPELHAAVGISGSGKTYGIRRQVLATCAARVPVIVVDTIKDAHWRTLPRPLLKRAAGFAETQCTAERVTSALDKGALLVVVRPSYEAALDVAEAMAGVARDWPTLCGVAIPEAHRIAPNGRPMPPAIGDVVTAFRHHKVRAWFDSQRLALLNTSITELARDLRIYTIRGRRDFAAAREIGDEPLVAALRDCAERFDRGERGWHVALGVRQAPPFRPERFK